MSSLSTGTTTGTAAVITADTSGDLVLKTGSSATTAMTILGSNQAVGIGTASPNAKLEVYDATETVARFTAGSEIFEIRNTGSEVRLAVISADPLTFRTSNTEGMQLDASGNLRFNSGYGSVATAYGCRAWVNFNGTGTVAIRASGNVSSITDNGTGDYTVNFTTAMGDINYAVATNAGDLANSGRMSTPRAIATSSVRVVTTDTPGSNVDYTYVSVAIFR